MSRVIHYGYRPFRAACGAMLQSTLAASSDRARVTCEKCKGTRKYQLEWFGGEAMRKPFLPHPIVLVLVATMAYIVTVALGDWLARPAGWTYLAP